MDEKSVRASRLWSHAVGNLLGMLRREKWISKLDEEPGTCARSAAARVGKMLVSSARGRVTRCDCFLRSTGKAITQALCNSGPIHGL